MASAQIPCPVCKQELKSIRSSCPHCHASPDWIEVLHALEFTGRRFQEWTKEGRVSETDQAVLQQHYEKEQEQMRQAARTGQPVPRRYRLAPWNRCWSCKDEVDSTQSHCLGCGAPWDSPIVRSARSLRFLAEVLRHHEEDGALPLSTVHDLAADIQGRLQALRHRLEKERIPVVLPAETPASAASRSWAEPPPAPASRSGREDSGKPGRSPRGGGETKTRLQRLLQEDPVEVEPIKRRPIWEILLDPRSIQWLLGSGGALLVIGIVIWLATLRIFDNPWIIAAGMGIGNAAMLFGGWAIIQRTRFQLAGRALTLLACLIMPLNLWFYHAHDLITLDGHLWAAALVCCVLYAISAVVLKDPLFVYVFLGGITMTGLLLLAELGKFTEIAGPSTLLILLGLGALHAERAFPPGDSVFSRRRFGLAFFWSSQALLAAGLLLILGAQLFNWIYDPILRLRLFDPGNRPAITDDPALRLLAIALVLAATYAFVYADLVVRRVGWYLHIGVFTLLWAEVLIIHELVVPAQEEVIIVALALTGLLLNFALIWARENAPRLVRFGPTVALLLCAVPVLLGVSLYIRATDRVAHDLWKYDLSWPFVCCMVLTALSCRAGAHMHRHTQPILSVIYFFGTATATMLGAAGLLTSLDIKDMKYWDNQVPLLMLVPIIYLLAARAYRGHTAEKPLVWVAHSATGVMIFSVLLAALHITEQTFQPKVDTHFNLMLALFFFLAAVFYGLAAGFTRRSFNVYLATACGCATVWQLMTAAQVEATQYTAGFALLGLVLLVAYRFAGLERWRKTRVPIAAFECANALLSVACVAGILQTLSQILLVIDPMSLRPEHTLEWKYAGLLTLLGVACLLAAWIVRHVIWRRWYIVAAVLEGLVLLLTLEILSDLTIWQKFELFCVILGLVLLGLAHLGWYREAERQNELVDLGMWFGSLLTALPLIVAVLIHRAHREFFDTRFDALNEFGMLAVGLLMLSTGFIFQLRATTLIGAGTFGLWLVTLLMFIKRHEAISAAGLALAIGGAVLFAIGLLLSLYRDKLLSLPGRIKRREGIFKVLGWR